MLKKWISGDLPENFIFAFSTAKMHGIRYNSKTKRYRYSKTGVRIVERFEICIQVYRFRSRQPSIDKIIRAKPVSIQGDSGKDILNRGLYI